MLLFPDNTRNIPSFIFTRTRHFEFRTNCVNDRPGHPTIGYIHHHFGYSARTCSHCLAMGTPAVSQALQLYGSGSSTAAVRAVPAGANNSPAGNQLRALSGSRSSAAQPTRLAAACAGDCPGGRRLAGRDWRRSQSPRHFHSRLHRSGALGLLVRGRTDTAPLWLRHRSRQTPGS